MYASGPLRTRSDASYCNLSKMPLPNNILLMQKEGRIALAIDSLGKGHFTSLRSTAKSYDTVYSTLQHRIRGQFV
jgi:hypothetical protein